MEIQEALQRICRLQPAYSATNTADMKERGTLLRGPLQQAVKGIQPILSAALGPYGNDLLVEASDGIGRKTELPWVRFCSKRMSPTPTEGFYSVIHFSTDGSAVHVTVGCGSSKFRNGSSVPLPGTELDRYTDWARTVIDERFGSLAPFLDVADFGATRPLPKSFQRATAISKRIPVADIASTNVPALLAEAGVRLQAIYAAQTAGRDLSQADQNEIEIQAILEPVREIGRRQGFGLSPEARRTVELHAMGEAKRWLEAEGYGVSDCSATESYDFLAKKGETQLKVEVKGTTSDLTTAILMTSNEVNLHRAERGTTALIIVSRIRLVHVDGVATAKGGWIEPMIGWNIDHWTIQPTAYRLIRQ